MKYKRTMDLVSILAFAIFVPANALAQTNEAKCKQLSEPPDAAKGAVRLVIDGNNGKVSGPNQLDVPVTVEFLFMKTNPFKYKYTFSVQADPLNWSQARGVLNLLGGDAMNAINTATGLPLGVPGAVSAPTAALGSYMKLQAKLTEVNTAIGELRDTLDDLNPIASRYDAFVQDVVSDAKAVQLLCEGALAVQPDLTKLTDLKKLTEARDKADVSIKEIDSLMETYKADVTKDTSANKPTLTTDMTTTETETKTKKAEFITQMDKVKAQITNLEGKKSDVQKTIDTIREVFSSGKFYEIRTESYATPVRLNMPVVLQRRSDNFQTTVNRSVDAGKPTLHVSAGLGFSTIDDVKIVRQPGLASDGKTVESKFGYQNNGKFKPSGVVMLNLPIRFRKSDTVTFGPAGGLVVSGRGESANVEYIVGTSLGLKDTAFITIGLHGARVEKLAQGFKIGDRIPDGLTDPLPVEKNFKSGLMLAITYQFK